MHIRSPRFAFHAGLRLGALALAGVFATAAWTQGNEAAIARLKSVTGNVLVSKETGLASGDADLRLTRGTRVITTANSEAVVLYDNGCEVRLKPNQRFEVETDKPCEALVAQAESILLEPAGASLATGAGALAAYTAALPALGGGLSGLAYILRGRQETAVSPS